MLQAPSPRFRIYSKPKDYFKILSATVTGSINSGEDCGQLEQDICTRNRIEFAQCTPKARVAIYLAVRALLQENRRKVILSPYTISDVVNMVICGGGIPVFADLEPGTCNIDPKNIEQLIDDQTGVVLVTHLHGLSCNMEKITSLCAESDIPLIEDAAQAFGAEYKGQQVGTFGSVGIYSFGMYKNVNSFFGGMLVTSNKQLHHQVSNDVLSYPPERTGYYLSKVLSGLITDAATWPPVFKSLTFWIFRYGFLHDIGFLNNQVSIDKNPTCKTTLPQSYLHRMTPIQARLIRSQLEGVAPNNKIRIHNATLYHEGLQNIKEIVLPPLRKDGSHIYTYFPILVEARETLLKYMMKHGCDVAAQHLKNCADMDCFHQYYRDCPVARTTADQVILLPTYPRYKKDDIKRNISIITSYFKE